jgi:hypothetical protein
MIYKIIRDVADFFYYALFFLVLFPRFRADINRLDTVIVLFAALYVKSFITVLTRKLQSEKQES